VKTILGLDPSYRCFGWSVFEIVNGTNRLLDTGLIETEKQSKRRNISVSDDDLRRADSLAKNLFDLLAKYQVVGVAWEIPGGSQSASSAKGLGIVKGIVTTTAVAHPNILFQGVAPADVKDVVGSKTATKQQVFDYVQSLYPYYTDWPTSKNGKQFRVAGKLEHIADSIAVFLAVLNSSEPSSRTMVQIANREEFIL